MSEPSRAAQPPRLTHVACKVSDLERSIAFYREVCELEVVRDRRREGGSTVWLGPAPLAAELPEFVVVLEQGEVRERLDHLGFQCASREELDAKARLAAARGLAVEGPIDAGGTLGSVVIVRDPDGHRIEFTHGQPLRGIVSRAALTGMPPRRRDDGGWRRLRSRYLYESKWFNVRQDDLALPTGEEITYTQVEHAGYVVVVPLLDDDSVLMERVYRHTVQRAVLECPSGGRDGDLPEAAARRELEEETGYVAGRMTHLGHFVGSSGMSDEEFDVFLATGLRAEGRMHREATEQMTLERIPFDALHEQALRGELEDAPSALGVLLTAARRTRER